MSSSITRSIIAEFIGTAFLLCAISGAGFMGGDLAGGTNALVLLPISVAAGLTLAVMIMVLGPVSGGHFNPAISIVMAINKELSVQDAIFYIVAQILGGIFGVILANMMFGGPVLQTGAVVYDAPGQWLGEAVAAFGLALTIFLALKHCPSAVGPLVGAFIVAAHWFTSSTSFANPAVAIARMFNGGPAGIRSVDVPAFVAAEVFGAAVALAVFLVIFKEK